MSQYFNGGGVNGVKYRLLKKLYLGNRLTAKIATWYFDRYEGGQYCSQTLRTIWKETYDIEAGFGTYGCFTNAFRPHVKIGNYCSIAAGVSRLVGNHPMDMFSTHPFFHLKRFGYRSDTYYHENQLNIGNDVWIGQNAIILGGVKTIGDGAVIGAGSVVTHDVEPYSIVAGNPARLIRYRFDDETIRQLRQSQWWNLDSKKLAELTAIGLNIPEFVNSVNKEKNK